MPLLPELSISEEDWSHTPPAVQTVVIALWQQVQTLPAQVTTLQAEVAQLREQLGRNSQNSSKPPSSDAPSAPPRPKRNPSGRKPGGQPGHPGQGRKLIPVEQVQHVIDLKPTQCHDCGALLLGEDAQPVLPCAVTRLRRCCQRLRSSRAVLYCARAQFALLPAPPSCPNASVGHPGRPRVLDSRQKHAGMTRVGD